MQINDDTMSTSSDGMEDDSDNDGQITLQNYGAKFGTFFFCLELPDLRESKKWKIYLAPSTSMVWNQKSAKRNIPSSKSDSALIWNTSQPQTPSFPSRLFGDKERRTTLQFDSSGKDLIRRTQTMAEGWKQQEQGLPLTFVGFKN